ncbi:MAG: aldehyde dehydrogenase [Azospirillaceae bacterium]|nr:aldehyde dehydrogenase [Azospirillaceae bacterium]
MSAATTNAAVALKADRADTSGAERVGLLIGGASRAAATGAVFARRNPVSGEVVTVAAAASIRDVDAAVTAAAAAFPAWSQQGPGERRRRLLLAADGMERRLDDFVGRMMRETGATRGWSMFNVFEAARMLREAASMTTQITGEVIPSDLPGNVAYGVRRPVGVLVGIAPWNAPIILGTRAIAMPLACGNTVILKASEACPGLQVLIGDVLQEAGLGDGIVNVLTHAPEDAAAVVDRLISHPLTRRINFTGSTRVGRIIAEKAGRALKPVLLELGGKAPMVVLDDADLDQAVDAAIFGAFMNQGQICMSTERIVVTAGIADGFVAQFAARAANLAVADPLVADAPLGALVDLAAAARVSELVADAQARGAVIAAGGTRTGVLMAATVVDRVTPEMRIYHEESFGPVTTIVRVADDAEAVRVANDTEFGLSAAVFSRDIVRAMAVARQIDSGICHINGPTVHDEPQMPFGGTKASGYGRFGGKAGIAEFTELRWLSVQTTPRHYPF